MEFELTIMSQLNMSTSTLINRYDNLHKRRALVCLLSVHWKSWISLPFQDSAGLGLISPCLLQLLWLKFLIIHYYLFLAIYSVEVVTQGLGIFIRGSLNKFPDFFVWALLLIVHRWNSSLLRSILLRLQRPCCTVTTTSARPHGTPLVWACQWFSSQPLSSP